MIELAGAAVSAAEETEAQQLNAAGLRVACVSPPHHPEDADILAVSCRRQLNT